MRLLPDPPSDLGPTDLGSIELGPAHLSPADQAALAALYRRGTPENTLRAWERDLAYISAWMQAAFGRPPDWPATEAVALRFILDHATDLTDSPGPAQDVARVLIAQGLRRSLACPAPATLDRRIASWRAFHRMKNLEQPFAAPLIAQARSRARSACARPQPPKSRHPITRPALMLGWASGGRRRSEIVALNRDDLDLRELDSAGLIRIRLLATKTTGPGAAARVVVKGRPARAVLAWLGAARIEDGPVFRPVSQADRILARRLSADGLAGIVRHRLQLAGYPPGFASAHGLRAGFLTQAALDGAPLQAAMRLSLHRSAQQAQRYYADVDLAENPAADLLG